MGVEFNRLLALPTLDGWLREQRVSNGSPC
jgi:hypothetical protein